MTRSAYLDCVGGLAGDMLVAALLDAGGDAELLESLPSQLGLDGVMVEVRRVERLGVGALHVSFPASGDPGHRTWRTIRELLERADLPPDVRKRSTAVFARLAEAEAHVHRVPVDDVHFHELGAVDTIMDVCGAVVLLDGLGVEEVACSPLPVSRGVFEAAHGTLPLPPPAVVELLRGAPLYGVADGGELVTPTGAALAAELVLRFGELPPLTLERVGTGAGSRDSAGRPNVLRVFLGESTGPLLREVALLETNLDDLSPELVPDAVAACFSAGALDVWTTPAQMKKGRPGFVLSALAHRPDEHTVARAILEQTSALGLRVSRLARYELEREERSVELEGGSVRVKIGRLDGRVVNVAPEHDDCAELAARTGRPVKSVWAAALAAAVEP
ncbi:MAG: nickel pincer cofactor biosynthesis protein LarC [Candidatus Rokuibacteriota bacterium]|nr:MAG: nickel pincer cofactor biosynthesis protein LarC [Candidatus Rokubacteria bacterium]